jgi:hypothetical protein
MTFEIAVLIALAGLILQRLATLVVVVAAVCSKKESTRRHLVKTLKVLMPGRSWPRSRNR